MARLGVVTIDTVGWKTVALTWRRLLPRIHPDVVFVDGEKYAARIAPLRLPAGMQIAGRLAAQEAIRAGCERILFCNNQRAALLPLRHARKLLIYGDCTEEFFSRHYTPLSPNKIRFFRQRVSGLVSCGAQLVGMSAWAKDEMAKAYVARPDQCHYLPVPVDTDFFQPTPKAPGRPLQVLFIGGEFERKGGDILLQAAKLLREEPVNFEFVTTHPGEPSDRIKFLSGVRPQSPDLLAALGRADLFVLPTRGDASPVALIEAGACGLPMIVHAVGATPELVRNGQTGAVLASLDPGDYAAAIARYARDRTLLKHQGRAARERVLADYSLHAFEAQFVRILEGTGGV